MKGPYVRPRWAGNGGPAQPWSIEILKSGQSLGTTDLAGKDLFFAGRNSDICDIIMEHPSISRQHAAFQFSSDGDLFLYDLGSTHGTHVNKQKIEGESYVALSVGDIISFGESTRLYVINGPAEKMRQEYDSENLQNYRIKLKFRPSAKEDGIKIVEDRDNGASWGFREDAAPEKNDGDTESEASDAIPDYLRKANEKDALKFTPTITRDDVVEKDRKLFESLQRRVQKVENMRIEIERIRAKEGDQGLLTEGQHKTIARNEARMAKLQEEVEDLEDTIRQRNAQRSGSSTVGQERKRKLVQSEDVYDSSDDDFYDRTVQNKSRAPQGKGKAKVPTEKLKVETVSTLEAQLKLLEDEERKLRASMGNKLEREKSFQGDQDDPLDLYMQETQQEMQNEETKALQSKLEAVLQDKRRVETLLTIARPALSQSSMALSKLGEDSIHPHQSKQPQASLHSLSANDRQTSPPLVLPKQASERHMGPTKSIQANDHDAERSRERKGEQHPEDVGSDGRNPSSVKQHGMMYSDDETANCMAPQRDHSKAKTASITRDNDGKSMFASIPARRKVVRPPVASHIERRKVDVDSHDKDFETELEDMNWVPPAGQTGDGRSSLNEKYGY